MSKGLDYFKKVYDVVPGWVQKMHDYSPEMLNYYTGLRGEAFSEGALSKKEKDVLVASMNAARLYPRSMVYHTKGAIDNGASIPELVEYFLVAYLYKGKEALRISLEAIYYACELKGIAAQKTEGDVHTLEDILAQIMKWMSNEESTFIEEIISIVKSGDLQAIEEKILNEGKVSSRLKHLNMVGNYIAELRGKEAVTWIEKARLAGASEADLADLGYICILTAGIPAWFEISDSLKLTDEIM